MPLISSPATISNLNNSIRYCFGLVAYDAERNTSATTTASAIPFAAPTNLSATAGDGQVNLIWNEATGANSYKVYYGTASGSYDSSSDASGTNHDIIGLTNGTTYYFAVKSVNADGYESEYSGEIEATPVAPAS